MSVEFPIYNKNSHQMLTTQYRNFLESFSDGMWCAGFKNGPCVSYALFGLILGSGYDLSNLHLSAHQQMKEFLFDFADTGKAESKPYFGFGDLFCQFENHAGYMLNTLFNLLSKYNIFEVERTPTVIPNDSKAFIWEEYFLSLQPNQVYYFFMDGKIAKGKHIMSFQYLRQLNGQHSFRWFHQHGSNLTVQKLGGIEYLLQKVDFVGNYRQNNLLLYKTKLGSFLENWNSNRLLFKS